MMDLYDLEDTKVLLERIDWKCLECCIESRYGTVNILFRQLVSFILIFYHNEDSENALLMLINNKTSIIELEYSLDKC